MGFSSRLALKHGLVLFHKELIGFVVRAQPLIGAASGFGPQHLRGEAGLPARTDHCLFLAAGHAGVASSAGCEIQVQVDEAQGKQVFRRHHLVQWVSGAAAGAMCCTHACQCSD